MSLSRRHDAIMLGSAFSMPSRVRVVEKRKSATTRSPNLPWTEARLSSNEADVEALPPSLSLSWFLGPTVTDPAESAKPVQTQAAQMIVTS